MSLTYASVIAELGASMQAAAVRMEALVGALREVQRLHSRALLELPPELEQEIISLIGRHPRDGGEP